jgi:hypothetical protein
VKPTETSLSHDQLLALMRRRLIERPTVQDLANHFDLSLSSIEEFLRYYRSGMDLYDNRIYRTVESRIAHWASFLSGDWFSKRLNLALAASALHHVTVDLGFSVPYVYADAELLRGTEKRFLFVDKYASTQDFYAAIVKLRGLEQRAELDDLLICDIEDRSARSRVVTAARRMEPSSLLVVASEILEHLQDDEVAWQTIVELEELVSADQGHTYVTLPIGREIPSHFRVFPTAVDARLYVEERLQILWCTTLTPDSDASPFLEAAFCALGTVRARKRR